ncbi:MAG: M48 family metallopeptidase [Hahellaceae bacterium]|nr:M48 family metallopeptidase [Hahellaceae bacterium]
MPLKSQIEIRDITVVINHKDIKNLHLSVLPPDGRVRVAAPNNMSEQSIRIAVISRLAWIRRQQRDFAKQPRQSSREMVSGESHYLWGHRFRLSLVERTGKHAVLVKSAHKIELHISPGTSRENRLKCLNDFYRQEMKQRTEILVAKWQNTIGVEVGGIGIKKMKTKWGSCNIAAKRIWLNLELAKKPPECLEYILVHEMVHLLERHHNDRFRELMTQFMPNWRENRDLLNSLPLAYEDWLY